MHYLIPESYTGGPFFPCHCKLFHSPEETDTWLNFLPQSPFLNLTLLFSHWRVYIWLTSFGSTSSSDSLWLTSKSHSFPFLIFRINAISLLQLPISEISRNLTILKNIIHLGIPLLNHNFLFLSWPFHNVSAP